MKVKMLNRKDRCSKTLGPNSQFIGMPGSRKRLMTPCLVVDLDSLERNIALMAKKCKAHNMVLRPHAKSHKCVKIAKMQIKNGAVGISVANIGEAEVFAENGIKDILITSPIIGDAKIERLLYLIEKKHNIITVVDNLPHAMHVSKRAMQRNLSIPIYLDIDMGRKRTGVASIEQGLSLARFLHENQFFKFCGIQAYAGHLSHQENFADRLEGGIQAKKYLDELLSKLVSIGINIDTVSGGSTGTIEIDTKLKRLDELQYGSYIFMDVEYDVVDLGGHKGRLFEPSLFVRTTVVNKNWPKIATADAGFKHFSSKYAHPLVWGRHRTKLTYEPKSDEHGRIKVLEGPDYIELGDSIECFVPHCDPTVNLYNHYHVVRQNTLVDIWPVDARGAF